MKDFSLKCYLTSNLQINIDEITAIVDSCNTRKYKKDEYIIKTGDTNPHIYFVESGLLRQYTIDTKGKEHILYFCPENWFVSNRESLLDNGTSSYFIQALEETTVKVLDEYFIKLLSEKFSVFNDFNNKLLHSHINMLQQRIVQLLGASAEERYLHFIKIYPDIIMRVPQTQVAAYIGITPESLSRIRKDIAYKNHFLP